MATSTLNISYNLQPAELAEIILEIVNSRMRLVSSDRTTGRITAKHKRGVLSDSVPVVFSISKSSEGVDLKIEVSHTAPGFNKSQDQKISEKNMNDVVEMLNLHPQLKDKSKSGW